MVGWRPGAAMGADGERGFTLAEVLAALGVFSLAAMALVRLSAETTRAAAHMETRFAAEIVADTVLVDRMIDPAPLEGGARSGASQVLGHELDWTLTVVPTSRERLFSLRVTVRKPDTAQVLVERQTLSWQE